MKLKRMKHGQRSLGEGCVGEVLMYYSRAAVHMRKVLDWTNFIWRQGAAGHLLVGVLVIQLILHLSLAFRKILHGNLETFNAKVKSPAIFGWNKSETITNQWVGQGLAELDVKEAKHGQHLWPAYKGQGYCIFSALSYPSNSAHAVQSQKVHSNVFSCW